MIAEHLKKALCEESIHPVIVIQRDDRRSLLPMLQEVVLRALRV